MHVPQNFMWREIEKILELNKATYSDLYSIYDATTVV